MKEQIVVTVNMNNVCNRYDNLERYLRNGYCVVNHTSVLASDSQGTHTTQIVYILEKDNEG